MHKFLEEKWFIMFFVILTIVIALLFENSFPDAYMMSLSRHPGSLKIPVVVFFLMISVFLGILTVLHYKTSKNYLLNKGFLEAPAEILSITENESFGSPRSHSLYLILHVAVKPTGNATFKADIKTTVEEHGNVALPPVRRIPDYKVGDIVMVVYHPESHQTIIPSSN